MKKIYQTPTMEVYNADLETFLQSVSNGLTLMSSDKKATTTPDGAKMESNSRQVIHEDGLRDWNIDLW